MQYKDETWERLAQLLAEAATLLDPTLSFSRQSLALDVVIDDDDDDEDWSPNITGLPWIHDDGGRGDAGFIGQAGDCVTRSITIVGGLEYLMVYNDLHDLAKEFNNRRRHKNRKANVSPRNGVHRTVIHRYLVDHLGWSWTPTRQVGLGTTHHLRPGEVPGSGRHVLSCSGHLTALVDGVIHDTFDPCREGTRGLGGYWTPPTP